MYTTCMCGASRGQKRVSDPLELECWELNLGLLSHCLPGIAYCPPDRVRKVMGAEDACLVLTFPCWENLAIGLWGLRWGLSLVCS